MSRARRLIERLAPLERGAPSFREVALAGVVLALLGIALYGRHVRNGGFYIDDWVDAAAWQFAPDRGLFALAGDYLQILGYYRPLQSGWIAATWGAFGLRPGLHLAAALAIGVLAATCLYWALRTLGLERLHSLLIAGLVLSFPGFDSTRLWTAAAPSQLAIALWMLGLIVALFSVRRGRLALHAIALALYAASLLTYPVTAGAIALSAGLYVWVGDRSEALRRWIADLVVLGATLIVIKQKSTGAYGDLLPVSQWPEKARTLADRGIQVFELTALPGGSGGIWLALAAAGLAVAVMRLLPDGTPARDSLRRWLLLAGAGVVLAAAGYLQFIPSASPDNSLPEVIGPANRVSALAGYGMVIAAYGLLGALAVLATQGLARPAHAAAIATATLALVLGGVYFDRTSRDAEGWDLSALLKERIFDSIERARGAGVAPPPKGTVYTFNHPLGVSGTGVPVVNPVLELPAAVRVLLDDPTLAAAPVPIGTRWRCSSSGIAAVTPPLGSPDQRPLPYGSVELVDALSGHVELVRDREACISATRRYQALQDRSLQTEALFPAG